MASTAIIVETHPAVPAKPKPFPKLPLNILIFLISAAPILRMLYIIASTGGNTPSTDDIHFGKIIEGVLSGSYQWKNLFKDTFLVGHCCALPALLQVAVAYLFHGNVYVSLYLGIGLAIFKLILLKQIFSRFIKTRLQIFLWPVFSIILFSVSQISTFEFDFTSLQVGLSQLGFFLGIWALLKFPNSWKGVSVMGIGGIVACWSFGTGPAAWPIFLVGMWFLNFRKMRHYLAWLASAILGTLPYSYFLLFHPAPNPSFQTGALVKSLLNYKFIMQAIGWPLTPKFSFDTAYQVGAIGLMLLAAGLALAIKKYKRSFIRNYFPSILILGYAILTILQLSIFRGTLTQWYAALLMLFWVGLAGFALLALGSPETSKFPGKALKVWGGLTLTVLGIFLFASNRTYLDKSAFMKARSPASESCLRNFQNAPTYCEPALFIWEPGRPHLVAAMAQSQFAHQLSVFAPRQQWTLQGDFILPSVQIHQDEKVPPITWFNGMEENPASYSDYRHLNLLLHPPNSIDWRMSLPKNLRSANFKSAFAMMPGRANSLPKPDGAFVEVHIVKDDGTDLLVFKRWLPATPRAWEEFSVPLTSLKGQRITLRLKSEMGGNSAGDFVMFRFPRVELDLEKDSPPPDGIPQYLPANTDLSPFFPKTTEQDFVMDPSSRELWEFSGLTPQTEAGQAAGSWKIEQAPALDYKAELNVPLNEYCYLYLKMAVDPEVPFKAAKVRVKLNNNPQFKSPLILPLLADGKLHGYTYDLKLLEPRRARLTGLRIEPVGGNSLAKSKTIEIREIRLIRKNQEQCASI